MGVGEHRAPLTLRLEFRCLSGYHRQAKWLPLKGLAIYMSSGGSIGRQGCSGSTAITNRHVSTRLDFPMSLDLGQVAYVHVCGQDFYLEK